jgi:hypothetical protein
LSVVLQQEIYRNLRPLSLLDVSPSVLLVAIGRG